MKYQVEINEVIEDNNMSCVGVFAHVFTWFIIGLSVLIMMSKVL